MNAKTLKALKGSIKKWKAIVAGTGEERGTENCPLCWLFNSGQDTVCKGCPVYKVTESCFCLDSPFDDWTRHQWDKHHIYNVAKVRCKTCKDLAQAELDFLKSLLPKIKKESK